MSLPVEFLILQEFIERQFVEIRFGLFRLNRPAILTGCLNPLRRVQPVQLRHTLRDSDQRISHTRIALFRVERQP